MRNVALDSFLTEEEIKRCKQIYHEVPSYLYAKKVSAEIITPVLPRINKALGQANDPTYLAYAILFVMENTEQRSNPKGK